MKDSKLASRTAVERLLNIDWEPRASHVRDAAAMVHDYLRTALRWAEYYGVTSDWPFFDIATLAYPLLRGRTDAEIEFEELRSRDLKSTTGEICRYYIRWASIPDHASLTPSLPDPFASLIRALELAGEFSFEHGYIDLGAGAAAIPTIDLRKYSVTS